MSSAGNVGVGDGDVVVYVPLAAEVEGLAGPGFVPFAGPHHAFALVSECHGAAASLDEDLGPGVLAVAIVVGPFTPVFAQVPGGGIPLFDGEGYEYGEVWVGGSVRVALATWTGRPSGVEPVHPCGDGWRGYVEVGVGDGWLSRWRRLAWRIGCSWGSLGLGHDGGDGRGDVGCGQFSCGRRLVCGAGRGGEREDGGEDDGSHGGALLLADGTLVQASPLVVGWMMANTADQMVRWMVSGSAAASMWSLVASRWWA